MIVKVRVGFTVQRPVIPDQGVAYYLIPVDLDAYGWSFHDAELAAELRAVQWCQSHRDVVMATSSRVVGLVDV